MGNPKDIFKKYNLLSEKEIKEYFSGNLSVEQKRKIERKIAQDDFNMDAIEGFETNKDALSKLEEVKTETFKMIDKKSKGWQFHHSIMLAIVLVVLMLVLGSKLFPESGDVVVKQKNANSNVGSDSVSTNNLIDNPSSLSENQIDSAVLLPEIQLILANTLIDNSPILNDSNAIIPISFEFSKDSSYYIEELISYQKPKMENSINLPSNDKLKYIKVPHVYMHKFKVVNYAVIYKNQIDFQNDTYTGTSAILENKESELNEVHEVKKTTIEIPYKEYLNETMKFLSENDFKTALKRFNIILESYPEDLNAHFYSAICYYNISQFDKAINHFDVAFKHPYKSFSIDAQWYKAKTYFQSGEYDSAEILLKDIIQEGDYYKTQAQELLKKLK